MPRRKITTAQRPRKPKPDKHGDEIGQGLHTFATVAYIAALKYYVNHCDDPAALAAFTRQLEDEEWPEFISVEG